MRIAVRIAVRVAEVIHGCHADGALRIHPSTFPALECVMLGTVLLVILILLLVGAMPTWPHSRSWGYYPSGGIGVLVLIVVVLLLMGRF